MSSDSDEFVYEKAIYIVTHGEKESALVRPNPRMTEKGYWQVVALRELLPQVPAYVVVGSGRRHMEVMAALGLKKFDRMTAVFGTPDSLEKEPDDKIVVVTATGEKVARSAITTAEDMRYAAPQVLAELPHNTVVCAGRPAMIALGMSDTTAKSAAVYKIVMITGRIANIAEITANGEIEIGAV